MNKEKEAKERTINISPKTARLDGKDKEGYEVKIKTEKPKLKMTKDEELEVKADIIKIDNEGKKAKDDTKKEATVKLKYDKGS